MGEYGSSLRKPVLRELVKILGQQGIGDQGEDVANAVSEVLHELVALEVGLAQNIGAVFFDQRVEGIELLLPVYRALSAFQWAHHCRIGQAEDADMLEKFGSGTTAVAPDFKQLRHAVGGLQVLGVENDEDAVTGCQTAHELGNALAQAQAVLKEKQCKI